jgi:pimeloyl-ACP methyl ester carboxylesterase
LPTAQGDSKIVSGYGQFCYNYLQQLARSSGSIYGEKFRQERRQKRMAQILTRPKLFTRQVVTEHVYVQAHGTKLHYQVAGPEDAPPLVLLHGIGGCVNWWDGVLPALTPYFRTYALDLPGFGRSWRMSGFYSIDHLADYLGQWLKLVGLEKVTLLGHSLGGQVATRFAARHPEQIERLILVAPAGLWPTRQERLQWFVKAPRVKVPLQQVLTIATGTMRTDALALLLSLNAILQDGKRATESLNALTMPTLVLWGTADSVLPPVLGPRVLSCITNAPARLEYIENGTHDMMFDQAEAFNRRLLEFLLG